MWQLLDVYSDLVKAWDGTHSYGGNVAEIYEYRLLPHRPGREMELTSLSADTRYVAETLYSIMKCLENQLGCNVEIEARDEQDKQTWMRPDQWKHWLSCGRFSHRYHVRVTK